MSRSLSRKRLSRRRLSRKRGGSKRKSSTPLRKPDYTTKYSNAYGHIYVKDDAKPKSKKSPSNGRAHGRKIIR